jgi:hypothetical protein
MPLFHPRGFRQWTPLGIVGLFARRVRWKLEVAICFARLASNIFAWLDRAGPQKSRIGAFLVFRSAPAAALIFFCQNFIPNQTFSMWQQLA